MTGLSVVFELDKIQTMTAGMPQSYHYLTDTTRLLCLDLLSRHPSLRWKWTNNNDPLTDGEWDTAQEMVDLAIKELTQSMLTGMILEWSLSSIPEGFLLCDGSEIDRSTELGQLLVDDGCPYGVGDGSTTVNLPDFSGRVPVGMDTAQTEFDTMGETGGEKTHTLTNAEMPSHNHSEIIATAALINGGLEAPAAAAVPGASVTGSAGSDQPHNNLQPYLVTVFIIKT